MEVFFRGVSEREVLFFLFVFSFGWGKLVWVGRR